MKTRFTDEQIIAIIKEQESGEKTAVNRPQFTGGSKVSMDGAYGKK